MLKAILLIAGLLLAVAGGEALYRELTNRSPVVTTCTEYARTRPSALWLRIRECEVDYLGAGYRESGGAIRELFFPVRPVGVARTEPAPLVAATREPSVLAIAESGIGGGRHPDQEQFLVMMLKIVTALGAAREIDGRVRAGIFDRFSTRRLLSGLTTPLTPGAVVVDLHAQPSLVGPAIQTVAGLGLMGVAIVLSRRAPHGRPAPPEMAGTFAEKVAGTFLGEKGSAFDNYSPEGAANAAAFPPVAGTSAEKVAGTSSGRQATPVRLRGLLLVNLGRDDGAQHIEYAAPLGPRDETIQRICRTIAGMQFDERGRGMVRRGASAVIVDVGLEDPVAAAIAGADGADGADAIRRLLIETGWRAYSPRTGVFVDAADLEKIRAAAGSPDAQSTAFGSF